MHDFCRARNHFAGNLKAEIRLVARANFPV